MNRLFLFLILLALPGRAQPTLEEYMVSYQATNGSGYGFCMVGTSLTAGYSTWKTGAEVGGPSGDPANDMATIVSNLVPGITATNRGISGAQFGNGVIPGQCYNLLARKPRFLMFDGYANDLPLGRWFTNDVMQNNLSNVVRSAAITNTVVFVWNCTPYTMSISEKTSNYNITLPLWIQTNNNLTFTHLGNTYTQRVFQLDVFNLLQDPANPFTILPAYRSTDAQHIGPLGHTNILSQLAVPLMREWARTNLPATIITNIAKADSVVVTGTVRLGQ